jgi:hypothetical protein
VTSGIFYPVMVAGTGNNTPSIRSTSTAFSFDANAGELNATSFNSLSDISLKTNITKVESALEKICQLDGFKFDWKNSNKSTYGVIAQEVEKLFPELISENNDLKSVNYSGLIAILIECVKELNSRK